MTVSGMLGHSTVSTTANIYCHAMQEAKAKANAAVASSLDMTAISSESKKQRLKCSAPKSLVNSKRLHNVIRSWFNNIGHALDKRIFP